MIAQIMNIELNATKEGQGGKAYTGVAVTYQPPPYKGQQKEPTTRFLFGNSDVAKQFKGSGLSVKDWADIRFDDTKWKNPESFTKTDAPDGGGGAVDAPAKNVTRNTGGGYQANPKQQESIATAVALKEASTIVSLMVQGGGYSQANIKKREFLIEEVLATARQFKPFLMLEDDTEAVMKDLYPDGEGMEQEGFGD